MCVCGMFRHKWSLYKRELIAWLRMMWPAAGLFLVSFCLQVKGPLFLDTPAVV